MSVPESILQAVRVRKALSFAGYTILLYDYLLTLHQEITYFWNAPWTITKAAFLVNRYAILLGQTFILLEETGLLAHGSQNFCHRFTIFIGILMFFSVESIHVVVILRAWVIWGCKRWVTVTLISMYLVYSLSMLGVFLFFSIEPTFLDLSYLDVLGICIYSIQPYAWSTFVTSFVLDTAVFVLTMWSLQRHLREYRDLYPSSLIYQLVRDASMFYLVSIFYGSLAVVFLALYGSDPKLFIVESFGVPILAIVGQRLVLNLRGLTVRTYSPGSVSAEVDRQLAGLDTTTPERVRRSHNGDTEIRVFGLEDFENDEHQEADVVMTMTQSGSGTEAALETRLDVVDNAAIELGGLKMRRKRSTGSLSITEVPRLPGERHAT